MGAVAKEEPGRLLDLLGYMDAIIRASQKFARLACEEYDQRFRRMVAGDEGRQWALLDAGLYTECTRWCKGLLQRDTERIWHDTKEEAEDRCRPAGRA